MNFIATVSNIFVVTLLDKFEGQMKCTEGHIWESSSNFQLLGFWSSFHHFLKESKLWIFFIKITVWPNNKNLQYWEKIRPWLKWVLFLSFVRYHAGTYASSDSWIGLQSIRCKYLWRTYIVNMSVWS